MRRGLVGFLVLALLCWGRARGDEAEGSRPKRIISLAPSVTETLFALGAGEQVVGVCTFCDYPHEVEGIRKVGTYLAPNVEVIVARRPDVVIGVPPNNPQAIAALRRAGIRVVIVQVDTLEQIERAMRTIAEEAGLKERGKKLLSRIHRRMGKVKARLTRAPQRRVLMVVGQNPLIAVGSRIFLDELITEARGLNIAADAGQPWPRLSLEQVVAKAPEVIIDGTMGSEEKKSEDEVLGIWRNFPSLPAVKEHRVYGRSSDALLRPGPRLAEGFEDIARLIHPERFP